VRHLLDGGQVPGVREDDAEVHHRRFDDDRRDLAAMVRKRLLQRPQVVERDHGRQLDDGGRYAFALRHRSGRVGRPHQGGRRFDRDHQRVVVSVVRGLDLDQPLAAGEAASDPDRVEGRLSP
jgi:hypothetical protein